MADPFIAEIRLFSGNFSPRGWALCDGQLLPILQNTALFSLLGTFYGGDGHITFALPDLRGRSPMHSGAGPGLTPRDIGESGGSETVTLTQGEMPSHTHQLVASSAATDVGPSQKLLSQPASARIYGPPGNPLAMSASAISSVGGQPHNNRQPYLTVNFIIALQGIFPRRS